MSLEQVSIISGPKEEIKPDVINFEVISKNLNKLIGTLSQNKIDIFVFAKAAIYSLSELIEKLEIVNKKPEKNKDLVEFANRDQLNKITKIIEELGVQKTVIGEKLVEELDKLRVFLTSFQNNPEITSALQS